MKVIVNGQSCELAEGATVRDAASAVGVTAEARGIAVAVDGEVVPRERLGSWTLAEGQRVEVVRAMQGG